MAGAAGIAALFGQVTQGSSASGIHGYDSLDGGGGQTFGNSDINLGGAAQSLIPIAIALGIGLAAIGLGLYLGGRK